MLALGDAVAMVVLSERGFDRDDYALYHPAGALGRKLMRVEEVMRKEGELPLVKTGTSVKDVLIQTSATPGRPGAALVTSADGLLLGIFTDGDLRRLLEQGSAAQLDNPVDDFMGKDPKTLSPDDLAQDAHRLLRENRIDQAPVVDGDHRPVGLIDVQDLLDIEI